VATASPFTLGHDPFSTNYRYGDVTALCPTPKGGTKDTYIACLHGHRLSELIFYHPAGRFWLFQGIESAIFVSLSVALLAGTVWWMRFRVT